MQNLQPTERFSTRVENYLKYRPHYPDELLALLQQELSLTPKWEIADVGAGTGFSAELFLKNGNRVYGVEPNEAMRLAGAVYLSQYRERYLPVDGTAEETTLDTAAVDLILAGQAFHWFDLPRTKIEWKRILKPEGWVVLVWNERRAFGTSFLVAYEQLLHNFAPEYKNVDHRHIDASVLSKFFTVNGYREHVLSYSQTLDWDGLVGRVLSSSYVPLPGDPLAEPLMKQLTTDFTRFSIQGTVELVYDTKVYWGKIV